MTVDADPSDRFRPLFQLNDDTGALIEGVPAWMRDSVLQWLHSRLRGMDNRQTSFVWKTKKFQEIERLLHVSFNAWSAGRSHYSGESAWIALQDRVTNDEEFTLNLLQLFLSDIEERFSEMSGAKEVEMILSQAGSAWRVSSFDGYCCLERRVSEGVQLAMTDTMASAGKAGDLLRNAWHLAYSRDPNASAAYGSAIKAVEAAGVDVVCPGNGRATLGRMIEDMKAKPSKWAFVLQSDERLESVISLMKALWQSQFDRHGTSDPEIPITVSLQEAQAAVHTAALLVQWFSSGAITRSGD